MTYNNKGFLLRRDLFFVLIVAAVTVSAAVPVSAEAGADPEEGVLFSFGSGSKLRIVERSNIRVKENGTYAGLIYNESRGVLDYMWYEDGFSRYGGTYYVYEASKKDTRLIANPVDIREFCEIGISSQGRYSLPAEQILPVLRDFPVFPSGTVSPGDSWRDFGVRMVDPDNSGKYTKVRFYCEYRYEGLREVSNGP